MTHMLFARPACSASLQKRGPPHLAAGRHERGGLRLSQEQPGHSCLLSGETGVSAGGRWDPGRVRAPTNRHRVLLKTEAESPTDRHTEADDDEAGMCTQHARSVGRFWPSCRARFNNSLKSTHEQLPHFPHLWRKRGGPGHWAQVGVQWAPLESRGEAGQNRELLTVTGHSPWLPWVRLPGAPISLGP